MNKELPTIAYSAFSGIWNRQFADKINCIQYTKQKSKNKQLMVVQPLTTNRNQINSNV